MNYRPSQLAACASIIAINIFEEADNNMKFFKPLAKGSTKKELNTQIWNNPNVFSATGYSMDILKNCLHELAVFMSQNLHPDRLSGFNVTAIKNITSFD